MTSEVASARATPTRITLRRSRSTSTHSSVLRAPHLPAAAQLIIEPGRSMVASAAVTLYRVVTVKRGLITFVAVDGGMGDNLEVALFHQRFEAGLADRLNAADGELVTVVGRHCESGDVLIDGVQLPSPRVGDLLAVADHRCVLLHDVQQLQRESSDTGGLR